MTKENLYEMHRENILLLFFIYLFTFQEGDCFGGLHSKCVFPTSPIPLTPYLVVVHVKERETSIFLGYTCLVCWAQHYYVGPFWPLCHQGASLCGVFWLS